MADERDVLRLPGRGVRVTTVWQSAGLAEEWTERVRLSEVNGGWAVEFLSRRLGFFERLWALPGLVWGFLFTGELLEGSVLVSEDEVRGLKAALWQWFNKKDFKGQP